MVRGNNEIAHNHFHKDWQRFARVNFAQPLRKLRRRKLRAQKLRRVAPAPIEKLRPVVRCPTVRYHAKRRAGRGFTLAELKAVGVNRRWAQQIGIAVDYRRRNKSVESIQENAQRLSEYLARLILIPDSRLKRKVVEAAIKCAVTVVKDINAVKQPQPSLKARVITEGDRKMDAYLTLKRARNEPKQLRRKQRKLCKLTKFGGEQNI